MEKWCEGFVPFLLYESFFEQFLSLSPSPQKTGRRGSTSPVVVPPTPDPTLLESTRACQRWYQVQPRTYLVAVLRHELALFSRMVVEVLLIPRPGSLGAAGHHAAAQLWEPHVCVVQPEEEGRDRDRHCMRVATQPSSQYVLRCARIA